MTSPIDEVVTWAMTYVDKDVESSFQFQHLGKGFSRPYPSFVGPHFPHPRHPLSSVSLIFPFFEYYFPIF